MDCSDIVGQASSLSPRASCPRKQLGLEAPETGWKPVLLSSGSWNAVESPSMSIRLIASAAPIQVLFSTIWMITLPASRQRSVARSSKS